MKPMQSAVPIRKDEKQVLRNRRATLHITSLSQESRLVYSVDCIIVIPDDDHIGRTMLCQYHIADNNENDGLCVITLLQMEFQTDRSTKPLCHMYERG